MTRDEAIALVNALDECEAGGDRITMLERHVDNRERQAEARGAERATAISGNYVANVDCEPTSVTFANGRTVSAVGGYLSVGWDKSQRTADGSGEKSEIAKSQRVAQAEKAKAGR